MPTEYDPMEKGEMLAREYNEASLLVDTFMPLPERASQFPYTHHTYWLSNLFVCALEESSLRTYVAVYSNRQEAQKEIEDDRKFLLEYESEGHEPPPKEIKEFLKHDAPEKSDSSVKFNSLVDIVFIYKDDMGSIENTDGAFDRAMFSEGVVFGPDRIEFDQLIKMIKKPEGLNNENQDKL